MATGSHAAKRMLLVLGIAAACALSVLAAIYYLRDTSAVQQPPAAPTVAVTAPGPADQEIGPQQEPVETAQNVPPERVIATPELELPGGELVDQFVEQEAREAEILLKRRAKAKSLPDSPQKAALLRDKRVHLARARYLDKVIPQIEDERRHQALLQMQATLAYRNLAELTPYKYAPDEHLRYLQKALDYAVDAADFSEGTRSVSTAFHAAAMIDYCLIRGRGAEVRVRGRTPTGMLALQFYQLAEQRWANCVEEPQAPDAESHRPRKTHGTHGGQPSFLGGPRVEREEEVRLPGSLEEMDDWFPPSSLMRRGRCLMEMGRTQAALSLFDQLKAGYPEHPQYRVHLERYLSQPHTSRYHSRYFTD